MTFYMCYYPTHADAIGPFCETNQVGTMYNAFDRWSTATDQFHPPRLVLDAPQALDSGGFVVLEKFGEFPWSVREYHEWLASDACHDDDGEFVFDWAAVMDYPCESVFDDQLSKRERMEKTLENTLAHYALDPDYPVLPVLQGRSIDDYIWFYDQLRDHGIPTEYVGLGSVCRRGRTSEIVAIERAIRSRTQIERIHGFGIKISAFKHGASFDTADSQTWAKYPTTGLVCLDDGDRLVTRESDDPRERTVRSFVEYYQYVSRLHDRAKTQAAATVQPTLGSFAPPTATDGRGPASESDPDPESE